MAKCKQCLLFFCIEGKMLECMIATSLKLELNCKKEEHYLLNVTTWITRLLFVTGIFCYEVIHSYSALNVIL